MKQSKKPLRVTGARLLLLRFLPGQRLPPFEVLVGVSLSGESQIPGGKLDKGEDSLDAVLRETREETGLNLKPRDVMLVARMQDPDPLKSDQMIDYYGGILRPGMVPSASKELRDVRFVPVHQLERLEPALTFTTGLFWLHYGPGAVTMLANHQRLIRRAT